MEKSIQDSYLMEYLKLADEIDSISTQSVNISNKMRELDAFQKSLYKKAQGIQEKMKVIRENLPYKETKDTAVEAPKGDVAK